MKNNRGWGLRSELWICLGLIIFFTIAVILINKVVEKLRESDIIESKDNIEEVIDTSVKEKEDKEVINNNVESNNTISNDKTIYNYSNLEDKLVSATKKYFSKYYTNKEIKDKQKVTIVRLKTEELLDKIAVNDKECSGYVEFENGTNGINYYPYIKCGNEYTTIGYDSANDNLDL